MAKEIVAKKKKRRRRKRNTTLTDTSKFVLESGKLLVGVAALNSIASIASEAVKK